MDILLRNSSERDDEFVLKLFGEIKIAELNIGAWPEQVKNQLVAMQYNAYKQMIKNEYPGSEDYVIIYNSEKAGRLQLDNKESSMRIINISLLPAYHNLGIGSKILKDVLAEADFKNKPVYLEVDKVNPAFYLYKKLGFEVYNQDELKYSMEYKPKDLA